MFRRSTSVVLASALTALTLLAIPTLSFAGPYQPVSWRMRNQQGRIYQGVQQGQIGPREYRHLERQERRIALERYRFRHNDGQIGPRERARLQHDLNYTSRNIYHDCHN